MRGTWCPLLEHILHYLNYLAYRNEPNWTRSRISIYEKIAEDEQKQTLQESVL